MLRFVLDKPTTGLAFARSFSQSAPPAALHPQTRQRLSFFRQRRQWLLQCRSASWLTIGFIFALLAAIVVDVFWVTDAARWIGALLVYGIVALVGLGLFILSRRQSSDWRLDALRLEKLDPRLREHLLAAVELSDTTPNVVDSPAFRERLQQQVAQLVSAVNVQQLLPWQTVSRHVNLAYAACAVLILLALIPSFHLPQRIGRILFPFANLGRVGQLSIEIELPTPLSQLIPRDEFVQFVARVVGTAPQQLWLDMRTAQGLTTSVGMQAAPSLGAQLSSQPQTDLPAEAQARGSNAEPARFETMQTVHAPLIDYRIRSHDSATAWYRLTTVPRPRVLLFEKHVSPPDLPDQNSSSQPPPPMVWSDEHGNLQVLKGSHVELHLTLDQPTSSAELRWEQPHSDAADPDSTPPAIPLQPATNSHQLVAKFLADHSADYKIHLTSLDGGFENSFSPTYRIVVVDDLPPKVRWQEPKASSLIATTLQIIDLRHQLTDEMPVTQVQGLVRINAAAWQDNATTLAATPSAGGGPTSAIDIGPITVQDHFENSMVSHWALDLAALKLKPGDEVEAKLSATDRLGQQGESTLLRIHISPAALALEAEQPELLRRQVSAQLSQIADMVSQAHQRVSDKVVQPQASQELRQLLASTQTLIEQAAAAAENVLSSQDLQRAGEILAAVDSAVGQLLVAQAGAKNEDKSPTAESAFSELKLSQMPLILEEQKNISGELARHFAAIATHDIVSRHARQLSRMATAQQRLADDTQRAEVAPQQLQRQQQVLVLQLQTIQQSMVDSLPQVREESQPPLQQSITQLGQQIDAIERFESYGDSQATNEMTRALSDQLARLRLLSQLDGSLSNDVKIAERRLVEMAPRAARPLEQLAELLSTSPATEDERAALHSQEQVATYQLAQRRTLQRAATYVDPSYASDLGTARRATESTLAEAVSKPEQQAEAMREIAGAMRTLEAIEQFKQIEQLMEELLRNERWGNNANEAAWDAPRAWEIMDTRYQQATDALRSVPNPDQQLDPLFHELNQARWGPAAQRAGQQLVGRLWQPTDPLSAAADVELIREQLSSVAQRLQPLAQQARLTLQQHAPSVSQLARKASNEIKEVEQQTEQLAAAAARKEVPQLATPLAQLQEENAALQPPIQNLREALVDLADTQSLLDHQQLQRARTADTALEVVQSVDEQLQASLASVQADQPADEQADELLDAAVQQADGAAALEELADIYDLLDKPAGHEESTNLLANQTNVGQAQTAQDQRLLSPNSDALQRLREAAGQIAEPESPRTESQLAQSTDTGERYAQAEQLAALASQDPREVLRQLERLLPADPAMSQGVAGIAEQATRQSLQQLEQAAVQQQHVTSELEMSDPNFKAQKQLLLHDLHTVAESARRTLGTLTAESRWTAAASQNAEIEKQIEQASDALATTLEQARNLDLQSPFDELKATAHELHTQLQSGAQQLKEASEKLATASAQGIHQQEQQLNDRRREMSDRQRRIQQQTVRDAQDYERDVQQRFQQTDNELRNAQQSAEQRTEELRQSTQQLEQQPEQDWLKQQVRERETNLGLARAEMAAKKKLRDALERRTTVARTQVEQLNLANSPKLESVNPTAELSSQLSQQSAQSLAAMSSPLQNWETAKLAQPQATADQLSESQSGEGQIREMLGRAADDLRRASRHEGRLDPTRSDSHLTETANRAEQVAEGEAQRAEDQFAESRQQVDEQSAASGQASVASTATSRDASQAAYLAIEDTVAALSQHDAHSSSGPSATDDSTAQSSPTVNPAMRALTQSLSPLQKANLLDELDRLVYNAQDALLASSAQPDGASSSGDQQASDQPGSSQQESATAASQGSVAAAASPAQSLAEAAGQLSRGFRQAREPMASTAPTARSSTSSRASGNATSHARSSAMPHGPTAVRVLPVDRGGNEWGQLREQVTDELLEAGREAVSPRYRQQVEAYFRELAERGR